MEPAVLIGQLLPEFTFAAHDYGWSGDFPGLSATLFDRPISLEIHTRAIPEAGPPPPVSETQAQLVRRIQACLLRVLPIAQSALLMQHRDEAPEYPFLQAMRDPYVWLDSERDDGVSWTLVVGRSDNPEFGYHVEFEGSRLIELWSGD
jgi:hypothetical protein